MARLGRGQPFRPIVLRPPAEADGAVTGTLAVTTADDTISAAGTTTVVGSLAVTAANDTISAAGTTTVVGTLAVTAANDTLSAAGTTGVTGTLAVTAGSDTLSAAGTTTAVATVDGGGKWEPDKKQRTISYHLGAEPARKKKRPVVEEEIAEAPAKAEPPVFEPAAIAEISELIAQAMAQNAALSRTDAEIAAFIQFDMQMREEEDILILMMAA